MKQREIFESHYGRRVSDATWYRVKRLFNPEFPATIKNTIWLATVKKQIPKSNLNIACLVEAISKIEDLFSGTSDTVSGEIFLQYLKEREINVHPNTLTRWFKPLNGFRKCRIYASSDLKPVVLAAFTYKLKKSSDEAVNSFSLAKIGN